MNSILKNKVLQDLANLLDEYKDEIIAANNKDLAACSQNDAALYDRLMVNDSKVKSMQASVLSVMAMDDPEGKVLYSYQKQTDLTVENRLVPFGTILIIYESRPDVTIEAAVTAFKAGNKILLKGGKEARITNKLLTKLWQQALADNNLDTSIVQYLDYNRQQTQHLITKHDQGIDIIIPRGGEQLINTIRENTNIPMIISGRGNNFLYIDKEADFDMAIKITLDGKKRISVCNALDKVYIHSSHTDDNVKKLISTLQQNNIEVMADMFVKSLGDNITLAIDEDIYYQEFLAHKILLAQVNSPSLAISKINKYSGGHSAVIVTNNDQTAQVFQNKVDCAAVYHNASSRFTDGGEFGLGAEIAISTQKLHFRGPVGLNELVTNKWFINGAGHVRG